MRCVAAPVFNANNDLTAAISVVGTRLQINEDNRDYLAGKAIACAKDISRLLGWKSPSNNSPHHKENIMTLPKIKHVRALVHRRRYSRAGRRRRRLPRPGANPLD